MLRIGVDVGGTNTDAVVMSSETVVAGAKSPTTTDILSGVENSILSALTQANKKPDDIEALIIGTTHFVNAIVQRKNLAKTGLIRLSLPSGGSVLPFADWPIELIESMNGKYKLVKGGYEMDGSEISKIDEKEILNALNGLQNLGCNEIAISSVFATVRGDMEQEVYDIIKKHSPNTNVSLSKDIGGMGLLERENAALINATLKPLAKEVVESFEELRSKLNFKCFMFFTKNDGTLIQSSEVIELPVLTFACGPTNSMRGAAFLSKEKNALVVDVGGTTTDVGEVKEGFPRQAGTSVTVADVRTNFSMPDVISFGLGGGSIIDSEKPSVGPQSVGHELTNKAKVFGGDVLTASDVAVSYGRCNIGTTQAPEINNKKDIIDLMDQMVEDKVARARTSSEKIPVIAVGGGSVMLDNKIDGLNVIKPPHNDLANAVGAAIAQVSGQVSKVILIDDKIDRESAIKQVTDEATKLAVDRNADPNTINVLAVSDMPLSYLPGNNLLINVTVVGDLKMENK
jgi:N-methylhydantoinase A/oxoprolinase/acetone carboxylase beta subunit